MWALLVAAAALACVGAVAARVHLFGTRDGRRRAQALIVLGARVHPDGTPSAALHARVRHAVALYAEGLAPLVVFSGGASGSGPTEAKVASELAQQLGLPPKASVLEEDSHSTRENAARCAALLRARGLRVALVVTDGYHCFRARQWFRREGLEVATSPAPLDGRGLSPRARAFWTCREALALLGQPALLFSRAVR